MQMKASGQTPYTSIRGKSYILDLVQFGETSAQNCPATCGADFHDLLTKPLGNLPTRNQTSFNEICQIRRSWHSNKTCDKYSLTRGLRLAHSARTNPFGKSSHVGNQLRGFGTTKSATTCPETCGTRIPTVRGANITPHASHILTAKEDKLQK